MKSPEQRTRDAAAVLEQRFVVGSIATLVRDGETCVRHFTGVKSDATRAVAAFCDAGGWRVRTLSTPDTIVTDLRGPRIQRRPEGRFGGGGWQASQSPETQMLSRIGRLDLLDG